jgi:hypothetical protein
VDVVAVTQDESLIGITLSVGKSDSGVTHVVSLYSQEISQPCLNLMKSDMDNAAIKRGF